MSSALPFQIAVSEEALQDLVGRLDSVRWPDSIPDVGWDYGANPTFMRRLVHYWRHQFDWRSIEHKLNLLPQFTFQIDGQKLHFVHQTGVGSAPMPLVLTHGWPSTFAEMKEVVPMLADPASFGGDPSDAFHVVAPSLPGYGFSDAPSAPGVGPKRIAQLWTGLMAALGYDQFGAHGGDWGAGVATRLAHQFPRQVIGTHLSFVPGSYRPPLGDDALPLSTAEQSFIENIHAWAETDGAYGHIQRTKPQTLAYGLNDSPVGLAAWIVEKFHAWSDCDGDLERYFGFDELLTTISLYWFSGTIGSSMRLYRESVAEPLRFNSGETVTPPCGFAAFPKEVFFPPRSWVERVYNVQRWSSMPRGGHFAAVEAPELLVQDIREFFKPLRSFAH